MRARIRRRPGRHVDVRARASRSGARELGYGAFRFTVYGFMGVALEIVFYNLVRNFKAVPGLGLLFQFDWQTDKAFALENIWKVPAASLFGQCSLWMFLVYGIASFCIEFLYRNIPDVYWPVRSIAYGFTIFFWECLSGWLLKWVTGYSIWFYADPGSFLGMTSFRILPIWCFAGLLVEYLYRQLMDPDLVRAIETATLRPEV